MEPRDFYTGIVADLYRPLRSEAPDPSPYIRFVQRCNGPALELGCGDGDPILALRAVGLDVEGVDSSADMLDRCRVRAADAGVEVALHHQAMEALDLPGRRYTCAYLAGPTFCLLPDDATAEQALRRIAEHVVAGGELLVPLFVPDPVDPREGRLRELRVDDAVLRVGAVAGDRDEHTRTQTLLLRYEREHGDRLEVVERPWTLHWFTSTGFAAMAGRAGWTVRRSDRDTQGRATGAHVLVRA